MKIDSNEISEVIKHLTNIDNLGHAQFRSMCEWNAKNFVVSHNDSQGVAGCFDGTEVRKFYEEYLEREIQKEIAILATYGVTIDVHPHNAPNPDTVSDHQPNTVSDHQPDSVSASRPNSDIR